MGDWPLLTDANSGWKGVERLVAAGMPVVVGTGAVRHPKAAAAALAAHARKRSAPQGLMVIPRVLSRGTSVAAQKRAFQGAFWPPPRTCRR
jgi:dihydrodipicolinate synthase/N-acetylneuraminate lyase